MHAYLHPPIAEEALQVERAHLHATPQIPGEQMDHRLAHAGRLFIFKGHILRPASAIMLTGSVEQLLTHLKIADRDGQIDRATCKAGRAIRYSGHQAT
jgi:hypothetical protein